MDNTDHPLHSTLTRQSTFSATPQTDWGSLSSSGPHDCTTPLRYCKTRPINALTMSLGCQNLTTTAYVYLMHNFVYLQLFIFIYLYLYLASILWLSYLSFNQLIHNISVLSIFPLEYTSLQWQFCSSSTFISLKGTYSWLILILVQLNAGMSLGMNKVSDCLSSHHGLESLGIT